MIMEKIVATIKLMAKAGLFFADCDGNFSSRESDFINAFLNGILEVGDIDDQLKLEVKDTLNHSYALEEIVEETSELVDGFNEDERKAILFTISQFIQKVIDADGRVESLEREYYEQWKKTFGL